MIRVLDFLESLRAALWPRAARRFEAAAFLLPALLLVGVLVLGLAWMADASLRLLDTETFELSEHWTLANYRDLLENDTAWIVLGRSVLGAAVVTAVTLALMLLASR